MFEVVLKHTQLTPIPNLGDVIFVIPKEFTHLDGPTHFSNSDDKFIEGTLLNAEEYHYDFESKQKMYTYSVKLKEKGVVHIENGKDQKYYFKGKEVPVSITKPTKVSTQSQTNLDPDDPNNWYGGRKKRCSKRKSRKNRRKSNRRKNKE